jgi:hypothetical protein
VAVYELQLQSSGGDTLAVLGGPGTGTAGVLALSYARAVNTVGNLTLTLPPSIPLSYLQRDGRILVYRSVPGVPPALDMEAVWFIVGVRQTLAESGEEAIEVRAVDAVDLLRRRIVAYAAGSSQAVKSAAADNLIKAIVRENLSTSATDSARVLPSSLFRVSADTSQGPTIAKAFSRRVVLDVLREVADAATQAGTYLAFDVVWSGDCLEFRTYTQWRGVDHRFPGGLNPIILSPDTGSLTAVEYGIDYADEVTAGYVGGQGEESARVVGSAVDTARATLSPFARCEAWSQNTNTADAAVLADDADALVRAGRPRIVFSGTVNADAPGATYGRDYGFGDVVTAQAFGAVVDCRIDAVSVQVTADRETVGIVARSVA